MLASSSAASSCTCCPMAFAGSVTSGSWPMPIAPPSSPECAQHWMFLRPQLARRQPITASATLSSPAGPSTSVRAAAATWSRSQHYPDRLGIPRRPGGIPHDSIIASRCRSNIISASRCRRPLQRVSSGIRAELLSLPCVAPAAMGPCPRLHIRILSYILAQALTHPVTIITRRIHRYHSAATIERP